MSRGLHKTCVRLVHACAHKIQRDTWVFWREMSCECVVSEANDAKRLATQVLLQKQEERLKYI